MGLHCSEALSFFEDNFRVSVVSKIMGSEGLSMIPSPKQYGVTRPISTAGPADVDLQRTVELEKVCVLLSFSFVTGNR